MEGPAAVSTETLLRLLNRLWRPGAGLRIQKRSPMVRRNLGYQGISMALPVDYVFLQGGGQGAKRGKDTASLTVAGELRVCHAHSR